MRAFLAGSLLVVALALAGCGGSSASSSTTNGSGNGEASKPPTQVVADAVKAAESASAVHMSGNITAQGQQIGIDLTIVKGKGTTGSMTLKGQTVNLIVIGTDAYMKAGTGFWTQIASKFVGSSASAIASLVANKWIKFSASDPRFASFTAFTNPNALFESLKTGHGALKNNGETMYKGQSVVSIVDSSKGATFDVAATGAPYPVALVKTGTDGGTIEFGNWNGSVSVSAPSGAIDFSQFGG